MGPIDPNKDGTAPREGQLAGELTEEGRSKASRC